MKTILALSAAVALSGCGGPIVYGERAPDFEPSYAHCMAHDMFCKPILPPVILVRDK